MMSDVEQNVLIARAKAGDALALEALIESMQPQLYRFSMKMCRHPQDAEDVLQETLLTLALKLGDFREKSSLSTWLYAVARNFCLKKRRKSKFAPEVEESLEGLVPKTRALLQSSTPDPEELTASMEYRNLLQSAIQKLDDVSREVLVLRDVEGLRAKEVAQVLNISVAAVKSRLHRARIQLREHLELQHSPSKALEPSRSGCPDIRLIFSQHLEGDLSSDVCAQMESHVASCDACAQECDQLRAVLHACSTAPQEVPKDVQVRVHHALREVIGSLDK